MDKALEILRIQGAATAAAISIRPATQGKVSAVVEGNIGVIVELNSETDFAAGNELFQSLVRRSIDCIKEGSCNSVSDLLEQNASLRDGFNSAVGAIRENIRLARFQRYVASHDSYLCAYEHAGGKFATLLNLSCSNPEIFKSPVFQSLARDVSMQITALDPQHISREDVPADQFAKELRIELAKEDIASKPEHLREKIAVGRVEKNLAGRVLLTQAYVKDSSKTVADVIQELSALANAPVKIEGFARFALGEAASSQTEAIEGLTLPKINSGQ